MEPFQGNPQLLQAFQRGEPRAMAEVYALTVRDVHRYLHSQLVRTGRSELSQAQVLADILQEVYVRAFAKKARQAFRGPLFLPYANRIARNYLVDELRKSPRQVSLSDAPVAALVEARASRSERDPWLLEWLARHLEGLAVPLREVFEQRFVRGSSQEMARSSLGITRRALRTREARLRREVRQALVRVELEAPKSIRHD